MNSWLTVWAAAAERNKSLFLSRPDIKSQTIGKPPTLLQTHTLMYILCRDMHTPPGTLPALTQSAKQLVTSNSGKSRNYWHYCCLSLQPYSSEQFLQTRALSAVTVSVHCICLSPRWRCCRNYLQIHSPSILSVSFHSSCDTLCVFLSFICLIGTVS